MYLPRSPAMKLVYEFRVELRDHPERREARMVKEAPALFASEDWWAATRDGRLRREDVSGVIVEAYWAGQDTQPDGEVNNSIVVRADAAPGQEGEEILAGIYINDPGDWRLFRPGHRVAWAAVSVPLKLGGTSKVVLEMAVSLKPTEQPEVQPDAPRQA